MGDLRLTKWDWRGLKKVAISSYFLSARLSLAVCHRLHSKFLIKFFFHSSDWFLSRQLLIKTFPSASSWARCSSLSRREWNIFQSDYQRRTSRKQWLIATVNLLPDAWLKFNAIDVDLFIFWPFSSLSNVVSQNRRRHSGKLATRQNAFISLLNQP